MAEIRNHLGAIELQDGNLNAALDHAKEAEALGTVPTEDGQTGVLPGILATAEQIRGLVARRNGKLDEAIEHFRKANEVAGQHGHRPARAGLGAVLRRSAPREPPGRHRVARRSSACCRSPAPCATRCGSARPPSCSPRPRAALKPRRQGAAARTCGTLELSKALRFEHALPIDLYNVGFFHFVTKKPTEALSYFKARPQSASRQLGNHPVVKELYYFKGLAHLNAGEVEEAKTSLQAGLRFIQEAKDWRKMCSALENLATIEEKTGNPEVAKKLLTDAIDFAQQNDLREERKNLRKKLDALG